NPPGEEERYALRKADETASSLILVCRQWRRLALEFVYENIRLNHRMVDLLQSLRSSGRLAKRLELSVIEQEDPLAPVTPLDILCLCPNVEVLIKYDDDLLPHSLEAGRRIYNICRWAKDTQDGTIIDQRLYLSRP
ncbi:hypothetical protein DXG01_013671, partial [Tephrocybe rancida]